MVVSIPISQFISSALFPLNLVCCLHLHSCPVNRFICTIFLDATYMQSSLGTKIHIFSSFSFFWHSVQFSCSVLSDSETPRTAGHQASLSITNSRSLLKLMSIESISDAIHPSHPLSSPSPPTFNLSQHQGLFKWVSFQHQWPRYWSFSFSISPSNEYSGLISFRLDWLDLLAVQGTLKSLLQHCNLKELILQCSAFFTVQLSHDYWKNYSFDLYRLLSAKCVCFLIHCLGLS